MTESSQTETSPKNGDADRENKTDELNEAIIKQIEYYFGDINLSKDKFLKEQIELDEGWVPLSTMLKFKRLAALTEDPERIVDALAESLKKLVEVSEDRKKIRRSPNFPIPEFNEDRRKELLARTVYLKGFPLKDTTIDTCLKYLKERNYEPENVSLRKYEDRTTKTWNFKGSIFVTFPTVEEAKKIMEDDTLKIDENSLIKKWKNDYITEKQNEVAARQQKAKDKKANKQAKDEKPPLVLPTGAVLTLEGIPENVNRESIKEAIVALGGEVAFVKIEEGNAKVRLSKENTAKGVFEKCTDGKLSVNGAELKCGVLEGDDEKKFLDEMVEELTKYREKMSKNNKNKGGNRYSNRKRKNDSEDGPGGKRNNRRK